MSLDPRPRPDAAGGPNGPVDSPARQEPAGRAHGDPSGAPPGPWRSLEERAGAAPSGRTAETVEELLQSRWPSQLSAWTDPVRRRSFLQLMGASIGLAGLSACTRQPPEEILPYARNPEHTIPGRPRFFASAFVHAGNAQGVLVESHDGRPTKIEGNPDHPESRGATSAFAQAAVLGLYDPDRSQVVQRTGKIRTWEQLTAELGPQLADLRARGGRGLRILSGTVVSPTLGAQAQRLLGDLPEARWHQHEPVNRDAERRAALASFRRDLRPLYRLDRASVVLTLDADLLGSDPSATRHARDFAARRRAARAEGGTARLYALECSPTVTGATADHRRAARPSEIAALARELLDALDPSASGDRGASPWIAAAARDLAEHAGGALVAAGASQPESVHLLAHRINARLGALGGPVLLVPPADVLPADQTASLAELVRDLRAGEVECLLILGSNPVYDAPAELGLAEALEAAPLRVHHGLYEDETALRCHWHVPATHFLEHWSDARCADGTVALVQPLIAPLYNGRSEHELVAFVAGAPDARGHDLVREHWRARWDTESPGTPFEPAWRRALHAGVVPGTAFAPVDARPPDEPLPAAEPAPSGGLELAFRPDPTVWDGRYANNGWLQELPKPVLLTTWDNAALLSPETAEELGVSSGDEVEVERGGARARLAAWVVPGHPSGSVTLHLGYGRERAGSVGNGAGADVYPLRPGTAGQATGATLTATGAQRVVACVQDHHSMEGRDLVRVQGGPGERDGADEPGEHGGGDGGHGGGHHPTLLHGTDHRHDGYAWGMAVDLDACIGCNACVVACQAENNVPVVGRQEVARGREMHWLRVDRYWEGEPDDPRTLHQPVACMHCEFAPCEVVCPVSATTHSAEGLNEMTYNRCVGTRYCSNNCPYKVRRFNFFQYSDYTTESLKMLNNPDVTVRSRGVMEKCTYCVQRINQARIAAKKEDREIRDGEVVTACQAVCPTEAIVFGDQSDPDSRVARLKARPESYGLLEELNVVPRTTYLPRTLDLNPELA